MTKNSLADSISINSRIHPWDDERRSEALQEPENRGGFRHTARTTHIRPAVGAWQQPGERHEIRTGMSVVPFAKHQGTAAAAQPPGFHVKAAATRRTHLWEEMPSALRAYDRALDYLRRVVSFPYLERFRIDAAEEVLGGIIGSLRNNMDALIALPRIMQRDNYLYTHSLNVSVLLTAFALCSGKCEREVMTAALSGLFFDLGKTLLPKSLLHSNKKLSDTERTLIRRHPLLGHNLLVDLLAHVPPPVLDAALEHHERYDGSGYPGQLSGNAISGMGHLTAIADCYDALASRRPYRKPLFPSQALSFMYRKRDSEFHPDYLTLFVRMVGIYPVGSVVQLRDGYRGVVVGSNIDNPLRPKVMLVMDANGHAMPYLGCDLAAEDVADIQHCLKPEKAGIDPYQALGCRASMRFRMD